MRINWIVDEYILESRSVVGNLQKAIRDAGHNLHTTKYVPFADEQDYGPAEWVKEPTLVYGTHGFLRKCKIPFIPGTYGLNGNMNCNIYYSHIPNEWMLNDGFFILPFGVIKQRLGQLFELFSNTKFFIRPVSGFKTFTGMILHSHDAEFELNASQQLTSVMPETLCLVSHARELKGEFRFLIGNGEVIDGSEYRWDNILDIRHDYDSDCKKMADRMAKHAWQPDLIYMCDVALTQFGPKIVEINSFSCAGFYAMDHRIIVDRVSELAVKDFKGEL